MISLVSGPNSTKTNVFSFFLFLKTFVSLPGKPVWLPLNEKTVGPFLSPDRVFFSIYSTSSVGMSDQIAAVFDKLLK